MTLRLAILAAALAATALSATAAPPPKVCADRDDCINRPGLVMDGFRVESLVQGAEILHGGTVPVGNSVLATPAMILAATDGMVIVRLRGQIHEVPAVAVFVTCPSRRVYLGLAELPFVCP